MFMAILHLILSALLLSSQGNKMGSSATTITLQNNCPYRIWPGTVSASDEGIRFFDIPSKSASSFSADPGWSGHVWARTGCLLTSSRATCATGESPPFTFAEFTLTSDEDSYDVSLVQGYNVGIQVTASAQECDFAGCSSDVNARCPAELRKEGTDGETTVACKTPCQAFGAEEYCCTGKHSTPETCGQTRYSQLFKSACPHASTYAYDNESSAFTCAHGADYLVTFCPY